MERKYTRIVDSVRKTVKLAYKFQGFFIDVILEWSCASQLFRKSMKPSKLEVFAWKWSIRSYDQMRLILAILLQGNVFNIQ